MDEREVKGLKEVFAGILSRHEGDVKKNVAQTLIEMIVDAYDDTEGRIIQ